MYDTEGATHGTQEVTDVGEFVSKIGGNIQTKLNCGKHICIRIKFRMNMKRSRDLRPLENSDLLQHIIVTSHTSSLQPEVVYSRPKSGRAVEQRFRIITFRFSFCSNVGLRGFVSHFY